jgi:hypothetical protein
MLSLLRLPKNIRDRIWSHAYGDLIIHAQPTYHDQKMTPLGDYAFQYTFCQLEYSTEIPGCHRSLQKCQRVKFYWPIVCKQYWTETMKAFYATATFKVESSIDFYMLASSQQQSVSHMRNLELHLGLGIKHHNRIWSQERCARVIKHFESLQSLALLIGLVVEDDSNYTGTCISSSEDGRGSVIRGSRLEGRVWQEERNWLPVFLRSFQVHQLQADRTRVVLFDRKKSKPAFRYHEKDRRRDNADRTRLEDEAIQASLRQELEASMRAVLLGQSISDLFPNQEAENRLLLEDFGHT